MSYTNPNNTSFPFNPLAASGLGYGMRSSARLNSKRLSVSLPADASPTDDPQGDNPTPRTSRSHLLAGLRTQSRSSAAPASAPYHQTQHSGVDALRGANNGSANRHGMFPQTARVAEFKPSAPYGMGAGEQIYSLPEQVLAPPNLYDQADEMEPAVLQQMQMTSFYLAQRQQQLQQQLACLTASAQNMTINSGAPVQQVSHGGTAPPMAHGWYAQQVPQPFEVPGQPGVYVMYNPALGTYNYLTGGSAQQQHVSAVQRGPGYFSPTGHGSPAPTVNVTPPTEHPTYKTRSFTPPKKSDSPASLEHVEPLPPPSSNAFRRGNGNKKPLSLSINPLSVSTDGAKTSSAAMFGSQRNSVPPGPLTGTSGPGQARAGEHPIRQPRGPPPLEELIALPTRQHEGSKNFATRQRRRALDNLVRAGSNRRAASRSSRGSESPDDVCSRKMSPIGSEMQEKRGSQGSVDGFGLSSASSSEGEDGPFKLPLTPAPVVTTGGGGDRKKMMLGVLNAAEKRRSFLQ